MAAFVVLGVLGNLMRTNSNTGGATGQATSATNTPKAAAAPTNTTDVVAAATQQAQAAADQAAAQTSEAISAVTNVAATEGAVAQLSVAETTEAISIAATSEARQASAQATGTAHADQLESYKTTPPEGQFSANGQFVSVACGPIAYQKSVGVFTADANSKYINMGVAIRNNSNTTIAASAFDFTLLDTSGNTVAIDTATFSFTNPFQSLTLQPSAQAQGALAFLVRKDFVPATLIWSSPFVETVRVVIVTR